MKVREAVRAIEKDGWMLVRQKGSHGQFHRDSTPGTVTIAGHPSADLSPYDIGYNHEAARS
jgi:predicted RNA binding protein YcfA (HicA-like mRNA interferase family)